MKMVPVYSAKGDKILVCHDALDYYQSIGWHPEAPAKSKTKAIIVKPETTTKEAE